MSDYHDFQRVPDDEGEQAPGGKIGKIVGICCVVLVASFLVCGTGCYFFFQFGKQQRAMQYGILLMGHLDDEAQKKVAKEKFEAFVSLSEEGKIGFLTFGIIENRFNEVTLDGQVTDAEFDHLMKLVDDIIAKDGQISIQDYPAGK